MEKSMLVIVLQQIDIIHMCAVLRQNNFLWELFRRIKYNAIINFMF